MAFELKEGQGTFFRNELKEEGSKQPDYRGELMFDGTLCEIAGWIKEGKKGKWMSLSVKPKEERIGKGAAKREAPGDSIPF
jgi:hypothetical protein